jgi:hypothetical protein
VSDDWENRLKQGTARRMALAASLVDRLLVDRFVIVPPLADDADFDSYSSQIALRVRNLAKRSGMKCVYRGLPYVPRAWRKAMVDEFGFDPLDGFDCSSASDLTLVLERSIADGVSVGADLKRVQAGVEARKRLAKR